MTDETYTFEQTRVRLEGILVEVRRKDTSLEQSLELLEEGVRLLSQCNELIDQTAWHPPASAADEAGGPDSAGDAGGEAVGDAASEGAPAEADAESSSDEPEPERETAAGADVLADESPEFEDDERD